MACPCSPSYPGGWGGRIAWAQEVEAEVNQGHATDSSLGDRARPCLKNKTKQKQKMHTPNEWKLAFLFVFYRKEKRWSRKPRERKEKTKFLNMWKKERRRQPRRKKANRMRTILCTVIFLSSFSRLNSKLHLEDGLLVLTRLSSWHCLWRRIQMFSCNYVKSSKL